MIVAVANVQGREVQITQHAARRYAQRVSTTSDVSQAISELVLRLQTEGTFRTRRPAGIRVNGLKHKILTEGWLTLDRGHRGKPATVFPVTKVGDRLVATTCLVTGDRMTA